MSITTVYYKSPIGVLEIKGDEDGIQSIMYMDDNSIVIGKETAIKVLHECIVQLDEYFEGNRKEFDLKLKPQGTAFQQKVWKALLEVPFNSTKSYLQQSQIVGDVKAIRAVGTANGKNPISIIIPCHRIIGSDGSLTGYAGGVWRKKWLLEHESGCKQGSLF